MMKALPIEAEMEQQGKLPFGSNFQVSKKDACISYKLIQSFNNRMFIRYLALIISSGILGTALGFILGVK